MPVERSGKLVVATTPAELPALDDLRERATANEVPDARGGRPRAHPGDRATRGRPAGAVEPGYGQSSTSWPWRGAFAADLRSRGAVIETGREVLAIEHRADEMAIRDAPAVTS